MVDYSLFIWTESKNAEYSFVIQFQNLTLTQGVGFYPKMKSKAKVEKWQPRKLWNFLKKKLTV